MADEKKEKTVEVPLELLTKMQEQMAELERKNADIEAKNEGIQQMLSKAGTEGEPKLREKKNFEPKFRTVRIRKYPIAGNIENMGYVVGWTNRGAYQEMDRTGLVPTITDFLDVIFLGQEKTSNGKIKAEKIRLLDLFNNSTQVHCKILETKKEPRVVPTGEEIDVTVFDPAHGLMATGDKIDGYVTFSDIKYKIAIPGQGEHWVDAEFLN